MDTMCVVSRSLPVVFNGHCSSERESYTSDLLHGKKITKFSEWINSTSALLQMFSTGRVMRSMSEDRISSGDLCRKAACDVRHVQQALVLFWGSPGQV